MRLPSFSDLIAFDAAARLGTFTRAAEEQNVSQPAISRRVAALEEDLGCRLFDRASKPMALTANGERLFDTLRTGLNRLEVVVDQIRNEGRLRTISISAGSGFTAFWLIPRLAELQSAFPDINVRIVSETYTEKRDGGDLQIRFGDGNWPGSTSIKVLGEEVYPACSPIYLKGRSTPLSVAELKSEHLLQMDVGWQFWYEWRSWFQAIDRPHDGMTRVTNFDSYVLLVSAALAGQGICLCWEGLLDTFLDSGALVRLTEESAASERGYFVTYRTDLPSESPARQIASWLAEASAVL